MREIKFRAKRIDTGTWVYGQYFKTPLTDENSGETADKGWFFLSNCEPKHCIVQDMVAFVIDINTLGQYAGIKDSYEKEIYENDVVDCSRYENDEKYIVLIKDIRNLPDALFGSALNSREVIGNIFDNPKLLNQ